MLRVCLNFILVRKEIQYRMFFSVSCGAKYSASILSWLRSWRFYRKESLHRSWHRVKAAMHGDMKKGTSSVPLAYSLNYFQVL